MDRYRKLYKDLLGGLSGEDTIFFWHRAHWTVNGFNGPIDNDIKLWVNLGILPDYMKKLLDAYEEGRKNGKIG